MTRDLKWEKQTIVHTEEVHLSVMEPQSGTYLIHCDVYEWSPGIFKELLKAWGTILEEFYKNSVDELYCLIPPGEQKIGKFAEMFGFKPVTDYLLINDTGDERELTLYKFPVKETVEGEGTHPLDGG